MLVLDTNIYWTSWYLQLLPCMLPLYICLNLWLAVAVAALTNLPVTSVHISQLGGPSIWFLHTYLLLSRYTQWRHMCPIHSLLWYHENQKVYAKSSLLKYLAPTISNLGNEKPPRPDLVLMFLSLSFPPPDRPRSSTMEPCFLLISRF